jgi:hypothetical protein
MKHDVHRMHAGRDGFSVYEDFIRIRISNLTEHGGLTINGNATIQDHLLGGAAGGHTPGRKYFL